MKKSVKLNSRDRINQAERALEQEQSTFSPSVSYIAFLKRELVRDYRDEETYWWQKSKDKWLNKGDRNLSFFITRLKLLGLGMPLINCPILMGLLCILKRLKGKWQSSFFFKDV